LDQLSIIERDVKVILSGGEGYGSVVETDRSIAYWTKPEIHGCDIIEPKSMEIDPVRYILKLDCILDDGTEEGRALHKVSNRSNRSKDWNLQLTT
jgi:hypothetical protein